MWNAPTWFLSALTFAMVVLPHVLPAIAAAMDKAIGEGKLGGAGVVIANAPFGVAEHLRAALPWLCELMKQGDGAGWRTESPSAEADD